MTRPRTTATSGVAVEIDPSSFRALLLDIRGFDKALYLATRRRLRDAAAPAVADVKRRLMTRTFHTDVGLAKGLAEGTKLSMSTSLRTPGVTIKTTGLKLPAERQAMVKAFNQPTIRHPVYGHQSRWVTQNGRPYFGAVIETRKFQMIFAMQRALNDAAATIRAGSVT